ncbi:MAG: hypothetical protein IPK67_19365 [Planctomycetes bacterium]|nr:hypothetical protein [Planctomycetota bacterium]
MIALFAATALAASPPGVSHDVLGGGLQPGTWAGVVSAGFPTFTFGGRLGLERGWTAMLGGIFGPGRGLLGMIGVGRRWLDRPALRVSGELLLGGHLRSGELAMVGPAVDLRVRVARGQGSLVPYAVLETRHTLLIDRTVVDAAEGEDSEWALAHRWSPVGVLGLGVALSPRLGLDLGWTCPGWTRQASTSPEFIWDYRPDDDDRFSGCIWWLHQPDHPARGGRGQR